MSLVSIRFLKPEETFSVQCLGRDHSSYIKRTVSEFETLGAAVEEEAEDEDAKFNTTNTSSVNNDHL